MFPILICRDSRYGQTGATCCERKAPTAYSISYLVGFIQDLDFRRIILKCDTEPSTKALQDAVIHACVGVEVIPQGSFEGDHMANGRVEMAVREVKRQCRTIRISVEHNTCVRIADDSPLLIWLPRFAAQVMNKMRIGKDGKTRELRRTGRRWTKPMAQCGEKVWFRKIGEDGVSSFASRMTQGIFVGHHDRTGAASCITKNGVVRGKSWTRQTLSDASESANWEGLCGTPWPMVTPELRLTKKVTAEKEGGSPPLPRIVVERAPEVKPRRFYVLSADIEGHGHTGGCPGCAALASHGRATKPHDDEFRERIRMIIERTLIGKARMNAYRDRIAETERVRERGKELELSEVQEMCLWNPETEMMSRWRFDMRTHLAVTSGKTNTKRTE